VAAAREAGDAGFDVLIACAFNYEAHATEFNKLGRLAVLKARMNADLQMAEDLKNTGKGNLFVIFGEPDISLLSDPDGRVRVKVNGVDVFDPTTGEVRSDRADGIACWFIDTDYNEESFFVRHAYFLGANDPYGALKTTLKGEINRDAWETLHSDTSRPFAKPKSGRIAVKVINHLGDEVMKVFQGLTGGAQGLLASPSAAADLRRHELPHRRLTFTDSLARLTGEEQKAVKTVAFDLQMNPAAPGMQCHRLDKARDKNFWSVRVGSGLRLIVHRTAGSLLLCYVGHHDAAYQWAERRRLETRRGGAVVEIRERVEEVAVRRRVEAAPPAFEKAALFASVSTDDLMTCGVPIEWLDEVRRVTDDSLLDLAEHLPAKQPRFGPGQGLCPAEPRLWRVWRWRCQRRSPGVRPTSSTASRRQLTKARRGGVRTCRRPASLPDGHERRGAGAGAGVPLGQVDGIPPPGAEGGGGEGLRWPCPCVRLGRHGQDHRCPPSCGLPRAHPTRVLLTLLRELANALRTRLRCYRQRAAHRRAAGGARGIHRGALVRAERGPAGFRDAEAVRGLLTDAATAVEGQRFSLHFLATEWSEVVDAWQLDTWEAYRDIARLGRKTRLPEKQRKVLWGMFERVRAGLRAKGLLTPADLLSRLAAHLSTMKRPPFDFVVVDEAQDVSVAQLRFLAALGGQRANGLFFAGDLGQRIFQLPFSWKALGVDVRGRSETLHVNYRTSHQIRTTADRLLGAEVADVDGNKEVRLGTISVFNGPEPLVKIANTLQAEREAVARWLADRMAEGVKPQEAAVFVRSEAQMARARAVVTEAGLPYRELDDRVETTSGCVSIATMHLAKGLEFRAVAVMACDDGVIPLQERIESVADDSDLEEVFDTERHLLYVACTRARDQLLVTAVAPGSEFLDDLRAGQTR
jgi:hypothetical protein